MPCYSGYEGKEIQYNGVDPAPYDSKIRNLTAKINALEAGLCAIITELEKKGIANEVISQASKSGLIDLMGFWKMHSKEDETRLAAELHKFSEHEQAVLKRLLSK